jgi:hypothetical protein
VRSLFRVGRGAESLVDQLPIHRFVAIDHAGDPKVDGHMVAAVLTADGRNLGHRRDTVFYGVAEKPGGAIHHNLWAEPMAMAITGVPQAMDSGMTNPKGSGQVMGNSVAVACPIRAFFSAWLTSPKN